MASRTTQEAMTAACRCTTSGGTAILPVTIANERGAKPVIATMTKSHAKPAWK
jgi:hypothetical protein